MSDDLWLRRFGRPDQAPVRLICLPHAGGSASYFHGLARDLAPFLDVVCVQYPGRQDRRLEPALTSIAELADGVFAACRGQDRPTVLFGHSMGAVIAFEVALRMERAGVGELLGLVCSGRRAPTVLRAEDVHLRDDAGVLRELRELSGTSADVLQDEEIVRMILPALRADYRAVETYRMAADARVRAPISVLVGDADPRVPVAQAQAWAEVTDGGSRLRVFPGGHFYLDSRRAEVAAAIRESVTWFRAGDAARHAAVPSET